MSLDDPHTVDFIAFDDGNKLVVTLLDGRDWSDPQGHTAAFATKVSRYLDCIARGEVFAMVRDAGRQVPNPMPIRIHVIARCPPPPEAEAAMASARRACTELKVQFEFTVRP